MTNNYNRNWLIAVIVALAVVFIIMFGGPHINTAHAYTVVSSPRVYVAPVRVYTPPPRVYTAPRVYTVPTRTYTPPPTPVYRPTVAVNAKTGSYSAPVSNISRPYSYNPFTLNFFLWYWIFFRSPSVNTHVNATSTQSH